MAALAPRPLPDGSSLSCWSRSSAASSTRPRASSDLRRSARAVERLLVARAAVGDARVDVGGLLVLLLGLELLALDDRRHRGVTVLRVALGDLGHRLARAVLVEVALLLRLQLEEAVGRAPQ